MILALSLCPCFVAAGLAQTGSTNSSDVNKSAPDRTSERYWKILTRNPRSGTALDNLYRGYVDSGQLPVLLRRVQEHVTAAADDPNAHILYGLVTRRRGELDIALGAFNTAARLAPDNHYPCLLAGQTLTQLGRDSECAEVLQRAVQRLEQDQRRVPRAELLALYQQLGRAQLKCGRTDDAVRTWQMLGRLFAEDKRVQSQVATWLQNEGQWEAALTAWRRVRQLSADDPYTQLQANLAIAAVHAERGKRDDAVRLLDQALDEAKPDSWTDKDIRQRIGSLFRDDVDGLIAYLRTRVKRRPEELATILRLSVATAEAGEKSAAIELLKQAVERAPNRSDLRTALIEQLRRNRQFRAAIEQADLLVAQHPHDVDILLMAGQLHVDAVDASAHDAERKQAAQAAVEIWQRIPAIRGDDPQLAVQAAEACLRGARVAQQSLHTVSAAQLRQRLAGNPLIQAAEDFYREAIRRADDPAPYYEYLGEFLHGVGRSAAALAAWRQTVTPKSHSEDWYHLARIFRQYGYNVEAIEAASQAIALAPDNTSYREMQVELLRHRRDFDGALAQLDEISQRVQTPRKIAETLTTRVEILEESGTLLREIQQLESTVAADDAKRTWRNLWLLSRCYASQGDHRRSAAMLQDAVGQLPHEPLLIAAWAAACEASGDLPTAIEQYRQLAGLEPHRRALHVQRVVDLELQQGQRSNALQAADELFSAPAGRAQEYLQRAAIATLLKQYDAALRMLRQAVRSEPRDVDARLQLAAHLASQEQPREALEHYLRAYELTDDFDSKLSLVVTMAELGAQNQMLPDLLSRLQRDQERVADRRMATICLAEAQRAAGDVKAAQRQLDELLRQAPDDVDVLERLADLATTQNDKQPIIHYRKQIAELTNQPTAWRRLLATYEQAAGNEEEIIAIARRLVIEHNDVECLPALIDRSATRDPKLAARYVQASLQIAPADWRLTYRAALLSQSGAEATDFFEQTLRLCLADPSLVTSAEQKSRLPKTGTITPKSTFRIPAASVQYGTVRTVVRPSDTELNRYLPAFAELTRCSATYAQLRQWKIAQGKGSDVSSSRVRRLRRTRSRTNRRPAISNDVFEAAVDSVLALGMNSPTAADNILNQSLATGGQPEWIALRIQLLMHVASNRSWEHVDMLDRFAEIRPADPLPHLVRFYARCTADSEVDKQRTAKSLSRSFDWIVNHDRQLADHLTRNYAQQLVFIGKHHAAAELISRQLEEIETIVALREIALLSLQVMVPEFRQRFLSRALELAANPGTISEDLGAVLIVALADSSQSYDSNEWELLFALLDKYLGGPPNNARSRTVTSLSTYRQSTQLGQMNQLKAVQERIRKIETQLNSASKHRQLMALRSVEVQLRRQIVQGRGVQRTTNANRSGLAAFDRMLTVRNAYLSADQRSVLYYALNQAQSDDCVEPFLQWTRDQASDNRGSITRQVALGFMLWRAQKKTEALGVFEKLVEQHPEDAELRLNAATAALECNELQRCVILLSHHESLSGSRVESEALELASLLNTAIVESSDYDVGLGCLVAALEHQSVPQLSVFFQERVATEKPNVHNSLPSTPAPDRNEIAVGADRLLSRNPHTSALILSILDHGWQLDKDRLDSQAAEPSGHKWLDRIQTATRRHFAISPRNDELRVLDALILMRRSQFDEAQTAVRQWQSTGYATRWTDSSVRLLALAFLNEATTQPTADLLASRFIVESATQGAAERARRLLLAFTHSLAEQQSSERTEKFWGTFFAALADSIPQANPEAPHRPETDPVSDADPVSNVVELFSELPANTVPDAIHHLAKFMAEHAAACNRRNGIGRALQIAVHKANFSWTDDERSRALAALKSMMFSQGPSAPAELYLWNDLPERGVVAQRRSLAESAIRLAMDLGVLEELRVAWDKHALATSPSLLALRTEAAAAANDEHAVNDLIKQINELRTSTGFLTPVWTGAILTQVDADRALADWALRSGGHVWLSFSPGPSTGLRISQRKQMPVEPFAVTKIVVGTMYTDPGLTRLTPRLNVDQVDAISRLPRLTELELFNTSISDVGMAKLANIRQLKTLRLDGSAITDEGLVHLHGLKNLKHLTLERTAVTAGGIAELRQALPNCTIVPPHDDGPRTDEAQ